MEKIENISKDIWDKAFLFTDLNARLYWALNEKNDLERIHELIENPDVNPHKIVTIGEFTDKGFIEKEVGKPKPFSESLLYQLAFNSLNPFSKSLACKALFDWSNGPERPYSYDKVEILTDVINHTYDKIHFRDQVKNRLDQFDKDIDKDIFLIDCKSNEELIYHLKYWGRDSWRKVVDNFIEERKTGVKSNKEFIDSNSTFSIPEKVLLLYEFGFFGLQKWLNISGKGRDRDKIMLLLLSTSERNARKNIGDINKFLKSKSATKARKSINKKIDLELLG